MKRDCAQSLDKRIGLGMDEHQLSLNLMDPEAFFEALPETPVIKGVGWQAPQVCAMVGITYRQLDYWARTKLVEPSITPAAGSGTRRQYSYRDIIVIKTVKKLLDTGLSLQMIRLAVAGLASRGIDDLASVSLFSDGTTVYELHSAEEVVDLMRGGQGVFGIALRTLVADTDAQVVELPGSPVDSDDAEDAPRDPIRDELRARRERKLRAAG